MHAQYGGKEIQAAFGKANLETSGQTGVDVFHFPEVKVYALLVTFQKTEREFSPSTMYADYPVSRELLHWESQANTAQHHNDGQNLIHHVDRGYRILVFARDQKKRNAATVPFAYLGQVVFASDADYRYYLDNPCEWKEKLGCKVCAYCLMTNHVHLIVDPGEDGANLAG